LQRQGCGSPRPRAAEGRRLAWAAGAAAILLHSAGGLKSAPLLAALPFDLTVALAAIALPLLALLGLGRDWRITSEATATLAAFAMLLSWLVLGAAWSVAPVSAAGKLLDAVLLGPPMLLAGILAGADPAARRGAAAAMLAAGLVVGLSVALGLASGTVVLGGPVEADRIRVQYQHAGLVMAGAAGIAALESLHGPRFRRPLVLALVPALAVLALLPGGRAAFLALALAAAMAPALALLRSGRTAAALLPPVLIVLAGLAGALTLAAQPSLADGLRTAMRLIDGNVGEASLRLPLWRSALDLAGRAAPFGLGTGGFPVAAGFGDWRGRYPHNHALEALVELGLPGLLLWLGCWGIALRGALRHWCDLAPERVGTIAALALPMMLTIMVSTDLGNRMAWFALGLVLSLSVEARPLARAEAAA